MMTDLALRRVLVMHPDDTVALCLEEVASGDRFGEAGVQGRDPVPAGHKIARTAMTKGDPVLKYGQVIGRAVTDIPVGAHVHVHNVSPDVAGLRAPARVIAAQTAQARDARFMGFPRADGRVATRNYIGVLTSVNCSATVARKIAEAFPDSLFEGRDDIHGVVALTHTTGCGINAKGEGADILTRTIGGMVRHVNFAGVLLVGLGCEVTGLDRVLQDNSLTLSDTVRTLSIQEVGGTARAIARGREIVRELIEAAGGQMRVEVSAAHLMLGLQCGGSDGWSGVTANPALGRASDLLVAAGGTAILSETPEIYGAEHLLMTRAVSPDVARALQERLDWWQAYTSRHGGEMNNNPSPGNIKGGLTTILEKSLGAVAKSGASPLRAVYGYGEPIRERGFVFMDSPGYDPCSATGQMASGANILAFTTGRGSVFGSKPAPCIKLASNAAMAARMDDDMDVDCSGVLNGVSLAEMGEAIFARMLAVASGEKSKSEALGLGDLEFVPWQLGAVM
jgi:altronate hydrolase